MKLEFFRGQQPNFGDELNTWLWPQLLPKFLDDNPRVLFLGIGSILGQQFDVDAKKVVFGTGYASSYHSRAPDVHGGDWDVFFVRGPRTARSLGLPESAGIGDSAILLRALGSRLPREPRFIGFMPHWESMQRGNWRAACKLAGIRLIDPTAPVDEIIKDILACQVLITEVMHGAIVADALRVPWIPLLPIDHVNREKWFDWADALQLDLTPHRLWPSTPDEMRVMMRGWPSLSIIASSLSWPTVKGLASHCLTYAAAQRLFALSKEYPCLSADRVLECALQQMLEKLTELKRRYKRDEIRG